MDARSALRPKDIVHDINERYGINIGYNTSWRARWSALTLIRGSPKESFTRLPTYLYNLELQNPGTRTAIRTDSNGRFKECFVAIGVAVCITTSHVYILNKTVYEPLHTLMTYFDAD